MEYLSISSSNQNLKYELIFSRYLDRPQPAWPLRFSTSIFAANVDHINSIMRPIDIEHLIITHQHAVHPTPVHVHFGDIFPFNFIKLQLFHLRLVLIIHIHFHNGLILLSQYPQFTILSVDVVDLVVGHMLEFILLEFERRLHRLLLLNQGVQVIVPIPAEGRRVFGY